jgi:hypothetical protein
MGEKFVGEFLVPMILGVRIDFDGNIACSALISFIPK